MLTPSLLAQMDPGHLIAAVHCEINSLTSTALERELLARLEACADAHDDALIENAPVTAALLGVLGAAGIHDSEALKSRLALTA